MTVKRKVVRSSTLGQQSGTTSSQKPSAKQRPSKPRVDIGPKSYGVTRLGKRIVIRFFVQRKTLPMRRPTNESRWIVLDVLEESNGNIAAGTKPEGYGSKENAIEVAREYRDTYGAYGKADF